MRIDDFQKKYNYKKNNGETKICYTCKYCTLDVIHNDDGGATNLCCKNPKILDNKMIISFFDICDLWEEKRK